MLTDIFANRYAQRLIWSQFGDRESRLLVQGFRIISEQLMPYWHEGKEDPTTKAKWTSVHDRLSMELGLMELSPKFYSHQTTLNGKPYTNSGSWTMDKICGDFVLSKFNGLGTPDRFIKERISLIELAFRTQEKAIRAYLSDLDQQIHIASLQAQQPPRPGIRVPGSRVQALMAVRTSTIERFEACVNELNERFRQAGVSLNYHNGFIQLASDHLVENQVERPFWNLLKDPKWRNVDIDMKEAIDRRDSNDRDPSFYAARALESTIKIISDEKGWTHGGEKGAHSFIDNLGSKKNGNFIDEWEKEALKSLFTSVRNPLGHGPGSKDMPQLSPQQTELAIEQCMSWIKSLINRM